MFAWLIGCFRPLTVERVREKQIQDARLAALEHRANAEHHEAMAGMLERRVERLRAHSKEGVIRG